MQLYFRTQNVSKFPVFGAKGCGLLAVKLTDIEKMNEIKQLKSIHDILKLNLEYQAVSN